MGKKSRFLFIGVIAFACLVGLIFAGYWFNLSWVGVSPEMSEPKQHAKTLWDWLNLLGVFAIPVVVALGAARFSARQEEANRKQRELELEIALDNQREAVLQEYINKISELLLKEQLRESITKTITEHPEIQQKGFDLVTEFIQIQRTIEDLIANEKQRKKELEQVKQVADKAAENYKKAQNDTTLAIGTASEENALLREAQARQAKEVAEENYQNALHKDTDQNQQNTAQFADIQVRLDELAEQMQVDLRPENEVQTIARVRTLTVLSRLDDTRKGNVLQFLHESALIDRYKRIINLQGADFIEANLKGANLLRADLSHTNLKGANLSGANLRGANLLGADLRMAMLIGAKLREADLSLAQLSEVFIDGVEHCVWLIGADLSRANLSGANLTGAKFCSSYTIKSTNKDEHETAVKLARRLTATLRSVKKRPYTSIINKEGLGPWGWSLEVEFNATVNLSEANLREADLSQTNLRGANLEGADLSGADLTKADLTSAIVTKEQLDAAKSLKGAIMSDGYIHR